VTTNPHKALGKMETVNHSCLLDESISVRHVVDFEVWIFPRINRTSFISALE